MAAAAPAARIDTPIFRALRSHFGTLGDEVCSILTKLSLTDRITPVVGSRGIFTITTADLLSADEQNEVSEALMTASKMACARALNEHLDSLWTIAAVSLRHMAPQAIIFSFARISLETARARAAAEIGANAVQREIEEIEALMLLEQQR